ncbi:phage major capsid protein [Nocardia amikacinitolerans]|uniref:phage major capsid protein n=1 Tax=Nocardia amikacinitolerans TaxID=756689 RepID=UPI0020A4D401|nr:phage major capsid protein [Nocardia amikacinitolerans]
MNASNWVSEETGSKVLTTVTENSAAENYARRENMDSDALRVPRMSDVDVTVIPMSGAYPEDSANLDTVLLEAVKFGGRVLVPYEQLDDSNIGIVTELQSSWARSYARKLDNAVFGTTAAGNLTTVPFNSVYREVSQNAATHRVQTVGAVTYDHVSSVLGKYENGGYFSDPDTIVVAHVSLKEALRGLKDTTGRPLFIDAIPDTQPSTLFGYPIQFSAGAKTSATNVVNPTGNPLLVVGNKNHLILGVRSGPESILSTEAGFGTDEIHLKMRSRRAFAVGRATAFGVLEVTSA